jgi:hypothetical protein
MRQWRKTLPSAPTSETPDDSCRCRCRQTVGPPGSLPRAILAGVTKRRGLIAWWASGAGGDPGPNLLKRHPPTKRGPPSHSGARSPRRETICPRQ